MSLQNPHGCTVGLEGVLRELVLKRAYSRLPYEEQLLYFCKIVSENLQAARVGIWMLTDGGDGLVSTIEWDSVNEVASGGAKLHRDQAASYMDAIKADLLVVLDDAMSDPRCKELAVDYLPSLGVSSMLDCPLHGMDGLTGVLCVEHIGLARVWQEAEKDFVVGVASLISLGLEHRARLRAESAHQVRQAQLAQLAELTVGWLWETDRDFTLSSIVGREQDEDFSPEALIGLRPWEMIGTTPLKGDWADIRQRMEAHEDLVGIVLRMEEGNGGVSFTEISGRPRLDRDGSFLGYIGVAQDVSDRIRHDEALAASELRYRNASKLARLGHWVWDHLEDRCSFCSPELAEIYGVSVEEFMARSSSTEGDLTWVHPEDRERYYAVITAAAAKAQGYDVVARILRDDGQVRHLHERTEPVFDAKGRFIASTGVLIDVTDEVDLQASLSQQANRLSNIVDNLPGAIFRVRLAPGWPAIYRSAGYYRLFVDSTREAAIWDDEGALSSLNMSAADEERLRFAIEDAVAKDQPYEVEYGVETIQGEKKWVWERGRPVRTADGQVEVEAIMIDATERRTAEQALIMSQRGEALGQMTGGVAHDFNNLLAAIVGLLELMRDDIDNADVLDMLDTAVGAATRASDLVRNMLAFARRADLEPKVLALNQIVTAANSWVFRTLPSNIEVHNRLSDDLWPIIADESSTESALLNLVINARDAMPSGGRLVIETANLTVAPGDTIMAQATVEPGRYVLLSVSDTGHGMSQDTLNRIFEPFFTTKGPGKGSGLGLAMVFGFMKQSGGAVLVESEEGCGTTFKLLFRVQDKAAIQSVPDAKGVDPVTRTQAKILVAEDEPSVRAVIVMALQRAGYQVVGVSSGDAAYQAFRDDSGFDLLLTDVVMPGRLLGPELAMALRETAPTLPVIFLTGYAQEEGNHDNALRSGDLKLTKPIRRNDLLLAVERVLLGRSGQGAAPLN